MKLTIDADLVYVAKDMTLVAGDQILIQNGVCLGKFQPSMLDADQAILDPAVPVRVVNTHYADRMPRVSIAMDPVQKEILDRGDRLIDDTLDPPATGDLFRPPANASIYSLLKKCNNAHQRVTLVSTQAILFLKQNPRPITVYNLGSAIGLRGNDRNNRQCIGRTIRRLTAIGQIRKAFGDDQKRFPRYTWA